jgi:hypothetical protein
MERRAVVDFGLHPDAPADLDILHRGTEVDHERPAKSAAYLIFESSLHTFGCGELLAVTKPQNAEPLKIRETREISRMTRKGIP